jgi:hypothetical protein
MILDARNEFCDATSVAAAAGTALVGNVIDLGAAARDLGNGEPLYLGITVDTEIITGGTAGAIQFFLASDAQAAIAVDGTATIHLTSPSIVTDDAAANGALANAGSKILFAALPMGATYERYLGILSTVTTTEVTAGKINAFLTKDPHGWRAYPDPI